MFAFWNGELANAFGIAVTVVPPDPESAPEPDAPPELVRRAGPARHRDAPRADRQRQDIDDRGAAGCPRRARAPWRPRLPRRLQRAQRADPADPVVRSAARLRRPRAGQPAARGPRSARLHPAPRRGREGPPEPDPGHAAQSARHRPAHCSGRLDGRSCTRPDRDDDERGGRRVARAPPRCAARGSLGGAGGVPVDSPRRGFPARARRTQEPARCTTPPASCSARRSPRPPETG